MCVLYYGLHLLTCCQWSVKVFACSGDSVNGTCKQNVLHRHLASGCVATKRVGGSTNSYSWELVHLWRQIYCDGNEKVINFIEFNEWNINEWGYESIFGANVRNG